MAVIAINWAGSPGQSVQKALVLDPAWSGSISVKAYYSQGGPVVPAPLQPSFTRQDANLFVQFAPSATSGLPEQTYVEIVSGADLRFAGYLNLNYQPVGSVSEQINPNSIQGLPATLDNLTSTIAGLQSGKMDYSFSSSPTETAAKASGTGKRMILETVNGVLTIYAYDSAAIPPIQKFFTFSN